MPSETSQPTQTTTQTETVPVRNILRLYPAEEKQKKKQRNRVRWEEGVVDNEFMNKKKSKICCIFHPNNEDEYEVEETESESESSSSSSSSSDESDHEGPSKPNAYERQPKYRRKKCAQCEHEHNHG